VTSNKKLDSPINCLDDPKVEFSETLLKRYGELMSVPDAVEFLRFPNAAAFRQAESRGLLGVPFGPVAGSNRRFALTRRFANWVWDAANSTRESKSRCSRD
jgi:hypothetical protein